MLGGAGEEKESDVREFQSNQTGGGGGRGRVRIRRNEMRQAMEEEMRMRNDVKFPANCRVSRLVLFTMPKVSSIDWNN